MFGAQILAEVGSIDTLADSILVFDEFVVDQYEI